LSDEQHNGSIAGVYYVQVWYPRGDRWMTVASEESRREAARRAALVFPDVVDARGRPAMQVRVIGWVQLRRDAGEDAVTRAEDDLALHRAVEMAALRRVPDGDPNPA
jgi:hypothetical protein